MDNSSKSVGAASRNTGADGVRAPFQKPGGIPGVAGAAIGALTNSEKNAEKAGASADSDDDAEKSLYHAEIDPDDEHVYTHDGDDDDGEEEGRGPFALKKGPIATIIGFFLFLGGLIGGAQLSQPFSLIEQLRTQFNTMQTSVATRSNSVLKFQLDNKLMKNPIGKKFFDKRGSFTISKKQEAQLKQKNIFIEEVDGRKVMTFNDDSDGGKMKVIVADDSDLNSTAIKGRFADAEIMTFKNAFETDANFFASYKSASMTWRGAISNWFESGTMRFLSENRLTRNLFVNYKEQLAENGGDARKTVDELTVKGTEEIVDGGVKISTVDGEKSGEEIKTNPGEAVESGSTRISRAKLDSQDAVKAQLETIGNKYKKGAINDSGGGISGKFQLATNITCILFGFLGSVNMLVAADEALQAYHAFMPVGESVDKSKAGAGDGSLNEIMNKLNQVSTTVHKVLKYSGAATIAENVGALLEKNLPASSFSTSLEEVTSRVQDTLTTEEYTETGSAMSSEAITSTYSGKKINPDNPGISKFNLAKSYRTIAGALGISMTSFTGCMVAKMITNGAGVVEDAVKTFSCVAGLVASSVTFGASAVLGCFGVAKDLAEKVLLSVGVGFLISGIIAAITPVVSQLLMKNIVAEVGVDFGTITWLGAHKTMANVAQTNGNSLLSKDAYLSFRNAQQDLIAEEARYDQMTRSPFDSGSQYTFIGNLSRQLAGFVGSNSLMKTISSTSSVLSNSLIALTPAASAYDTANQIYDNYSEICPELDSIGAVGSAVCEPYRGTDMSTINDDPSEIIGRLAEEGNFMTVNNCDAKVATCQFDLKDDNLVIKENSDLANYIRYGVDRTSVFGIADQNIVNDVSSRFATVNTSSAAFNNVANNTIGVIPMVGDGIDVVNSAIALQYGGYVSGESMVAGNNVAEGTGTNWNKAKYYQRFIEDQALFETQGIINKSSVTAYIEKYREENPLDNSYEGILARYSGLEKEDVEGILAVLDYVEYINEYDPSTRFAFGEDVKPAGAGDIQFENNQEVVYAVLLDTIEFADVRNRSFVV